MAISRAICRSNRWRLTIFIAAAFIIACQLFKPSNTATTSEKDRFFGINSEDRWRDSMCTSNPESLFIHIADSVVNGSGWKRVYTSDNVLVEEYHLGKDSAGKRIENGPFRMWFDNGERCAVGWYKNGRREGCYFSWFRSGQLESAAIFRSDKSYARITLFSESGYPSSQNEFMNDIKHGEYLRWYENGKLMEEGAFRNGELDGPYVKYYRNGTFKEKGYYQNGKKNIDQVFARPKGSLE
jgi:antitoxin component YwqK of YwqJK toxin-antitoxin module